MRIDFEAEASWLLQRAGFTTHDAPGAYAIAIGVLGTRCIHKVSSHALRGAHAELAFTSGRYRIFVSAAVSPLRMAYAVLHELGHWRLIQIGYHGEDVERLCDAMATAMLAPRDCFRAAVRDHGEDWRALAADFAISQTIAAIRYGEVMARPIVVFDSNIHHVRGPDWPWPRRPLLRAFAKDPPATVRAERLTDNPRRTVLLAVG